MPGQLADELHEIVAVLEQPNAGKSRSKAKESSSALYP
jgi:hypothetical protein